MPEGWGWDDTLYGGSATYYSAGRLPYPPVIAEVLGRALELDGTERLLDVGCGPGSLTLLLASRVSVAIGVDADADMLAAAALTARRAGVRNVAWRRLRAEELPAGLGRFALVTFAQSFHWFDRPQVATAVHSMLDPDDGACVHVQATTHRGDTSDDLLDRPRPPHARIDALVQTYLGPVRRAGQGSLPAGTPADEDDILRRAGFTGPTRIEPHTAHVVTRTADEIVASTFSLSSSAPHLFGTDLDRFEADLRALLEDTAPDGLFSERTRDIALDIWRP